MPRARKVKRRRSIYRGRAKRVRKALNVALTVLLLIALVAAGFFISSGITSCVANMPEPSVEESKPESKPADDGAPESSTETSDETSEEVSEETVEPISVKGFTVTYDVARMQGEALDNYLAARKAEGYTHIFVQLKDENGVIRFKSDAPQAKYFGTVDSWAFDAEVFCAAVEKAEMTPAAFITALKDPLVAHVANENSFAYANVLTTNWLDSSPENGGRPWLNPYMDKARGYICEITADAAKKGFDLIVLTDVNFPTRNTQNMNTIKTEPSRNAILGQLLNEAQAAAGDVPVLNSINLAEQLMLTPNEPYTDMQEIGYGKNAPFVSLNTIGWNVPYLAQKFSVEADSVTVAGGMLEKFSKEEGLADVLVPVVSQYEAALMIPVLEGLGIDSFIVL